MYIFSRIKKGVMNSEHFTQAFQKLILPSEGFILRRFRSGDEQSLAHHANNPKIAQNLQDRFPQPYSVEDAGSFIEYTLDNEQESVFAIEVSEAAVGAVGLIFQSDIYRQSAEVGYWLGEAYWGRGIMSKAVGRVVEHAFSDLSLNRVFARVHEENTASIKTLEKAGFYREARLRKAAVKNGRVFDVFLYSRID